MRRRDSRLQHASNALAIGTGVLLAWSKYFAQRPTDAYSNAPNRWEPPLHDAHILVVPLLVYACGVIWNDHVLPRWAARSSGKWGLAKTFSGQGLLVALVPMVATGYLIQVTVEEAWRKAWVAAHLATSAFWSASYLMHWLGRARRRRA